MEHRKLVVATDAPNIRDNEIEEIPHYDILQLLDFSYIVIIICLLYRGHSIWLTFIIAIIAAINLYSELSK